MECPDDDGGHLEPADGEGERPGPVGLEDLAVAHGEVVERVGEVGVQAGAVAEPEELTVVLQDEVARAPVLDVLAWIRGT